jgi:glucose-6-phosphate isomerase
MTFKKYADALLRYPDLGFSLDLSRMNIPESFESSMQPQIQKAFADLKALEAGEIANSDEGRMVGHYWLRDPDLAPNDVIRSQITEPIKAIKGFAAMIPTGEIAPPSGGVFKNILIIGIGGSALGPQLINDALGQLDEIRPFFFDNTDPDGMDRSLKEIGRDLNKTLAIVISKSGGTPETRNGMLEAKHAYEEAGLDFAKHTIAVTGEGSRLDQFAREEGFITTFPMEDWVGGRTSVLSTVGLVPMAIQDIDFEEMLAGAKEMDEFTRSTEVKSNAAMRLALAWHHEGKGKGERDMVVLPYKDSLVLFSKYLQQLIMESLGKAEDLEGNSVNQGIAFTATRDQPISTPMCSSCATDFTTFLQPLSRCARDAPETPSRSKARTPRLTTSKVSFEALDALYMKTDAIRYSFQSKKSHREPSDISSPCSSGR